jgi:hypothetical protein
MRGLLALCLWLIAAGPQAAIHLSDAQALALGQRVFRNETGGDPDRLVWWNQGEQFASLGIGHFIWYPEGQQGPFQETFPDLLRHLAGSGRRLPPWLATVPPPPCPWPTRQSLRADARSQRVGELRELLSSTFPEQSRFLVTRLEGSLPRMLESLGPVQAERLRQRFYRVAAQPGGLYALLDYVNFKGDGTRPTERYRGEGWGLRQVLEAMPDAGDALAGFRQAARQVLTRRVANSPPERDEQRWLPGWLRRLESYVP